MARRRLAWYNSSTRTRMRVAGRILRGCLALFVTLSSLAGCNRHTPEACVKGGVQKFNQGDYKGAISDFSEAIRLNPKLAPAYSWRGLARTKTNDPDGAIADLTEAIDLKPDYAIPFVNRSLAWELKGKHDEAITDA